MEFELTDGRRRVLKALVKVCIWGTTLTTGWILGQKQKEAERALDNATAVTFFK